MLQNKKFLVALTLLLALAIAVPAFAQATTEPATPQPSVTIAPDKVQEITALRKQILDLKQQLIDKYLAAGVITQEQAKAAKERLERCRQNLEQNPNVIPGFFRHGHGRGCGGHGMGLRDGSCGNCPYAQSQQSTYQQST
ncbi:MAG: DUF2680 domain-containing protein [Bacillota bacterium]